MVGAVVAILLAVPGLLSAQTPDTTYPLRPRYGVYFHFNRNLHTANFKGLPDIPSCCPTYTDGTGSGLTYGVLYEHPFLDSFFWIIRAGYSSGDALLTADEPTTVRFNGQPVQGIFRHTIATQLSNWGVEPLFGYMPFDGLLMMGGVRLGYVTEKSFEQKETIVEPANGGTFENGKRTRNEFSGDIPGISSFSGSLLFGAGYEIPLNRKGTLLASPEIFYAYGLTPVVSDLTWSINTLRIGIALKYSPLVDTIVAPILAETPVLPHGGGQIIEEPEPEPEPEDHSLLHASVKAVSLEPDGSERPNVTIRVEEFISTEMRPLLNYVFFDENSSVLPDRYVRMQSDETSEFAVEDLHGIPVLPTYYHLLNIVGRRLHAHPDAKITLVGCNSDEGIEIGRLDLSRNRADTVRKYLEDVWGIAPSRISVQVRNKPSKPSDTTVIDGVIENRRVEIYSDTWEILEPVITHDTLRVIQSPDVRFHQRSYSTNGVADWTLDVQQSGKQLKKFSGSGPLAPAVDWKLNDGKEVVPHTSDPITYQLTVHDSIGLSYVTVLDSLPVDLISLQKKRRNRIADKEIGNYSLILFDFDRGELNASNQRIARFIRGEIRPEASVTITGYTDRIGLTDHNQRLSQARASSTASALGVPQNRSSGLGETKLLYDNELPEGRFYCRTVNVYVETPIEE